MEEEEESEENKEINKRIVSEEIFKKVHKRLAEHLSRFKDISKEMVEKILYKTPKSRTDVENRIVADYLSKNIEYFNSIKENNHSKFLKLIAVLNFEHYLPGRIIMDLYFEEDKFFIVFDGVVQVFRQYFYTKEMTLGNFTNYLSYIKRIDEKQYFRIIEQNKHMGIDFMNIKDNINFDQFEHKYFIFTLEEQEEIGQFSSGYIFGEMNLMRKKKKNIIVKSISKTEVISVSKFDFNRILKTFEEKRLELLSERFKKKFDIFKFWTMEQLITLFNYFSRVVFLRDEYIYKQNEPSNYIYFIEKGTFEQFSYTNYFYYKDYIEYIGDIKTNLINSIIDKKITNIGQFKELYNDKIKEQEQIDNLIKNNKIDKLLFLNFEPDIFESEKNLEKFKITNNLYSIKKEEDGLNNPELTINVPILTSEMPKIIGIEEPFELKRRFTSVKCKSGKLVAQRIKVYDLLKLLLVYNEFHYAKKFLNVIVQRKLILIELIKGQMKLSASKFEKQIDYKYNNLINQNEDKNKKFSAIKLKGWINGIYLDNVLDTNLYLFKPKTERFINEEREKRFQLIKALSNDKPTKNLKKTYKIYQKVYDENNKDSFLLTQKIGFLTHRDEKKESDKKGKSNEKSYTSTKFNKRKLISYLKDIDNIEPKKKSESRKKKIFNNADKIVTELNLKIKNNIKGKRINKLNLSELFSDLNIKTERKNKNQEENLFAITRPLNTNFRDKYRDSDYQFKRLASILEKESHKKTFIKNHKFDKKAFPAIFSQIKKMDAETGK
jgi:CRP-like cAMP-binding protein